MEVQVRVQDPSAAIKRDVSLELRDGAVVGDMVEALVKLFEWPRRTMSGEPLTYQVGREAPAGLLDVRTAIASLGLSRGDILILGPAFPHSK